MTELYTYWPKAEAFADLKPKFDEKIAVSEASLLSGVIAALIDNLGGALMEVTVTGAQPGFTVSARQLEFDEMPMPGELYNVLDLNEAGTSLGEGSSIVIIVLVDGSFFLPGGGKLPIANYNYEERKQLLESLHFAPKDDSQTSN